MEWLAGAVMVKQSKMGESTEQNAGRGVENNSVNFLAAAVFTRAFPQYLRRRNIFYIEHSA